MMKNSNIYSDISGTDYYTTMTPYTTSFEEILKRFIDKIGATRILFGSDNSFSFVKRLLGALEKIGINEEDKEKIMHENIERLLS